MKKKTNNVTDKKFIWILFAICVGTLFILAISIMIKNSISAPKQKRESTIQIEDVDESSPSENISPKKQFALGSKLMRSSSSEEKIRGMQIVMTANPKDGANLLIPCLMDPVPAVRTQAATLLSTYEIPNLGSQIVMLLEDPDKAVRLAASSAMLKYASEPGIMYRFMRPMSSRDPEVVKLTIPVWKVALQYDPRNAIGTIAPALSSSDESVLSTALGALTQSYPRTRDLVPYKTLLEGITARMGSSPSGQMAQSLLQRINAE
ncbi:TPA: hypothetical protein DEF17_06300 [bacterium]|nr:MAG: hypothetical protein AUJ18_00790 [Candidatus Hydrogenedentes bacterium CG1_02_42_14]HBW47527.1 hypothetical protein [bacterium]